MLRGIVAGAVGTAALNIVTYGDMTLRGRPASELPAAVAGTLADKLGLDLGRRSQRANRREGAGALMGYGSGLAYGALYGVSHEGLSALPRWGRLVVVTSVTTTGEWVATAFGLTHPGKWGFGGWTETVVPRAAYATTTMWAYDLLAKGTARDG